MTLLGVKFAEDIACRKLTPEAPGSPADVTVNTSAWTLDAQDRISPSAVALFNAGPQHLWARRVWIAG